MSAPSSAAEDETEQQLAENPTVARPVASGESLLQLRRMRVVEGPDVGRDFVLDPNAPSRILLGTSPACSICLTDPTVSRRHAALEPVGNRYRLTDLGSTNGTLVDGVAIAEAFLRGGEVVRFGSSVLRAEADAEPDDVDVPPLPSAMRFGRMMGASVAMRRLYPLCERVAESLVAVIIEGETGTGKEVLAESLHQVSGRKGPFVVFDCTAVTPNLMEATLFGHEKGAFTGAVGSHVGLFEEADGGTLLIDEIGDLDLPLQAKLLRVIDRGELRRVGGRRPIHVDVRVVAATRRDLDKAVAGGRFRDDLFHRLAVARVELPPLRERQGDIVLLARHFAKEMTGSADMLTREILARFSEYSWPGNVRELRNTVARIIALGDTVEQPRWPSRSASSSGGGQPADWLENILSTNAAFPIARRKVLEEFERRYVERILAAHDGNVSQAARASGLALRYFRLVKARQQK
ncbi:MAG: sigma 54-interacting transcriptional regulator [Myxococcota bacterium]|nr:sigma 54-interacting transcriptional regulator [Myxococcota bacterium]